ncbi:MAG: hypothetical protein PWP14_1185 [Methanolobus sp.]|nr:hypothetical protein [Methanolobus sp.]
MSIYSTEHWDNSEDLDGLLFFAQLMKEMLFNFTIDSYKAPIFTTYSLCDELIDAYDLVKNGFLSDISINSIKEEIIWSLENDFVAEKVLGYRSHTIITSLKREDQSQKYIDIVTNLYHLLSNKYFEEIKRQLSFYVKNPREKRKIRYLTKLLVSELLYWGYSQSYLFHENNNYFFNRKTKDKVGSVDEIEEFLSRFDFKNKEYTVIFKGNENFLNIRENKLFSHITIDNVVPEINVNPAIKKKFFNKEEEWSSFIKINSITAFDAYGARILAEGHLIFLNNLISYEKHQAEFIWSKECLVNLDDVTSQIFPEVNEMYKIRDCPTEKLTWNIEHFMKITSHLDWVSRFNIGYSLNLHNYALKSNEPAIQLLNLWSAIETLLPPQKDKSIISTFISNICPVLGIKYIDKLVNDFIHMAYVTVPDHKVITDILSELPNEYSDYEKFTLLLSVKEYEPLLIKFASRVGRNPLLINRIHILNEMLSDSSNIKNALEIHDMRIKWHLSRLYRSRNLIAHKGIALNYLSPLLENSHFYYHVIIEIILETIENFDGKINSLEDIFSFVRFEHEGHISHLNELKNASCKEVNFKELVLGI